MKNFMIIVLLLTVAVYVMSAPTVQEYKPLQLQNEEFKVDVENEDHLRHRRVTCDLLSSLGDGPCAANCISLGKAGGTCQSGICVCRPDTFKEVWDKRFPEPNFDPVDSNKEPMSSN